MTLPGSSHHMPFVFVTLLPSYAFPDCTTRTSTPSADLPQEKASELRRTAMVREQIEEVREADSRGRHTTTHRELFVLEGGGIVIDTPGMRELGLWDAGEGVQRAFGDNEDLGRDCAFRNCTHRVEPGCAVREAVAAGDLERRPLRKLPQTGT